MERAWTAVCNKKCKKLGNPKLAYLPSACPASNKQKKERSVKCLCSWVEPKRFYGADIFTGSSAGRGDRERVSAGGWVESGERRGGLRQEQPK